jgi:hypothetical protein
MRLRCGCGSDACVATAPALTRAATAAAADAARAAFRAGSALLVGNATGLKGALAQRACSLARAP